MRRRLISIVASAAALAACSGSLTNDIAFKPPKGWTETPAILGHEQTWLKNNLSDKEHREMVILVKAISKKQNLLDNPAFGNASSGDYKSEAITICGSQKAEHFIASDIHTKTSTPTTTTTNDSTAEAIITQIGDTTYAAFYFRQNAKDPADPDAEGAIRSLCPKR